MNANSLDRFIGRASAIGLLAMAGCAMFEAPAGYGLQWIRVDAARPLTAWMRLADVHSICAQPSSWNGVACAHRVENVPECVVYSTFTEEEARRAWWHDGLTVYDHEKKHCDGWDHIGNSVWSMTAAHGVVQ